MPYIECTYCKNIIVSCSHSLTSATYLVICQSCFDRGEFLPQTMARYFLIERSVYDQECTRKKQAQQTLKQIKQQQNLIQSGVLDTIINQKTKELTLKLTNFRDNTHQEEDLIRQDLRQAIDKIMKETEKSIRALITSQVDGIMGLLGQILDGNIVGERELAEQKQDVLQFIQSKKYKTAQGNEGPALISSQKLKEVVDFFNARINQFTQKKDRLTRLMQVGQDVINFATTEERQELIQV